MRLSEDAEKVPRVPRIARSILELGGGRTSSAPTLADFPLREDYATRIFLGIKHQPPNKLNARKLDPLDLSPRAVLYREKLETGNYKQDVSQMLAPRQPFETHENYIRNSFRKIEALDLFSHAPPSSSSSSSSSTKKKNKKQNNNKDPLAKHFDKQFHLVDESWMSEVTRFENRLRQEKAVLGGIRDEDGDPTVDPSWVLSDFQLNARIPTPAARMAIQNMCDAQMKKVRAEHRALVESWEEFSRKQHYDKPHLFLKHSYLDCAPVEQRALKKRLVKESVRNWQLRKDRDSMAFEDDLSYLNGLYGTAKTRWRDYERYFILASRYGVFSEETFYKDNMPGKRFHVAVTRAALLFQRKWDRFWAITKVRRYLAARTIQAAGRMFPVKRRLRPVIRIRMKIGKKTYFYFCMHRWKQYNHIVRTVRAQIHFHKFKWVVITIQTWRKWARAKREHKDETIRKFRLRFGGGTNGAIAYVFFKWVAWLKRSRYILHKARRIFQNPHFVMWVEYTVFSKRMRNLTYSARIIQGKMRSILLKKNFLLKKAKQKVLRNFYLFIAANVKVKAMRQAQLATGIEEWWPEELGRRAVVTDLAEFLRTQKGGILAKQREKAAARELNRHLLSTEGRLQVQAAMTQIASENRADYRSLGSRQQYTYACGELMSRCKELARSISWHDFNVRYPCVLQCPSPSCSAICSNEHQYHEHVKTSDKHDPTTGQQMTQFHMMLRTHKGVECLKRYMMAAHGISTLVNCIDGWLAMQDLKKIPTTPLKVFETKVFSIFELYVRDDGARYVGHFEGRERIITKMETQRDSDYHGYYSECVADRGFVRSLLGLPGKTYISWSDEAVINPRVFAALEWHCFKTLFHAVERPAKQTNLDNARWGQFKATVSGWQMSPEYQTWKTWHKKMEIDVKESQRWQDYNDFRNRNIANWTSVFKINETAMFDLAETAIKAFEKIELERLFLVAADPESHRKMLQLSYTEQSEYEGQMMTADDALCWTEENIIEFLYEHYVTSLVKRMWSMKECQTGILIYGGMIKVKTKKILRVDNSASNISATNAANAWFKDFIKEAVEEDRRLCPMPPTASGGRGGGINSSATVIQRRFRGMRGRRKVRKIFVKTYVKRYDAQSGEYYYENSMTGVSSWTRPAFIRHLWSNNTF